MQRLWTLLLSGLLWALLAATAQSQEGSSLYEPFPEPNSIARAERFVDNLRAGGNSETLDLSRQQLERGVVVDPRSGALEPAPVVQGDAAGRAAGGEGLAPSFGWLFGAALFGIACVAAIRLSRPASRPV